MPRDADRAMVIVSDGEDLAVTTLKSVHRNIFISLTWSVFSVSHDFP